MTNSKRGPLFLILFAALMAGAGNGISIVAFPWLVLQRNGSALDASIVAMAGTLPLLVATLIAGAAVDYLGRRRVSMISDALSALSVAAVPVIALTFGVHAINVAVLAALAALGAFFDPAGMTARETMLPEAATRAGWTLDHANSVYEAIFNLAYIVGPGIGGLLIATLGGINTMWVTAGAFVLSIVAIASLRLEGAGKPDRDDLPEGVWAGIVEGLRFVWNKPGAAHAGVRRPGRHRSVHADGERAVPEVLHRPQRAGATGLGADGVERRRSGRRARLRGAVEVHEPRTTMLTAVLTLGVAMTVDRVPAAAAGDPGAVRGRRPGLRADRADLQLRHADPRAAASARPGGRGDGVAGLRRGSAGVDRGRPAGRRRRAARDVPGAVAADAAARPGRALPAGAARPGPRTEPPAQMAAS